MLQLLSWLLKFLIFFIKSHCFNDLYLLVYHIFIFYSNNNCESYFKMKCNLQSVFIWYAGVAKNSIKEEDEHVLNDIMLAPSGWASRNWSLFTSSGTQILVAHEAGNCSTVLVKSSRGSITQSSSHRRKIIPTPCRCYPQQVISS